MPSDKKRKQLEVTGIAYILRMRFILFIIIALAFIAITVTFIVMALNKYEIDYLYVVGGSDSIIAVLMLIITRKLFKI